jgi:hypothetical protein
MGRNFLGDIIWQDTSLCKQFIDLQLVKSFQICITYKENVIEGDGPKNQTQSKMDLYETTVNAVLVN